MQIMRSNVYFLIVTANCKQSHVYDTLDVNFVLATLIFQVTLAAMRFPVFSRRGGGADNTQPRLSDAAVEVLGQVRKIVRMFTGSVKMGVSVFLYGRSHVCHWDHGVSSAAAVETGPRMVRSGSAAPTWTQSSGDKGAYGRLWWWK